MRLLLSALSVLLISVVVIGAPFENTTTLADKPIYRLDTKIWPSHYDLLLTPYLLKDESSSGVQFTFDGEVAITLSTSESNLKEIVVHAKNLKNIKSNLEEKTNPVNKINIENAVLDETTDKYTLTLASELMPRTDYILTFKFTGQMDDDMHGFYKSSYVDKNGDVRWLGSTQFQTIHARRAFPCFDEPKFKAVFRVRINHHKSFNVVSNTKIESSTAPNENNRVLTTFTQTPQMSTYLLAFLVSDFTERQTADKKFSVIARPDFYEQTEYSFEFGQKLLKHMDQFTNKPYYDLGNDKMHMAAIPDFSAGAMENWGLLTYRERALLYDEKSTTSSAQQSIAAVVAHEQAHMWFGDLVTCDWWGWTWLNEGFARYFQYFATHAVEPSWELDKQFVVDQIHSVFRMDSLKDTHPMSDLTIESPSDVSKMFGSISYNKGASIIRMIRHAMGEEPFKKALQNYLAENAFKTSVPEKLFTHFKAQWPKDVLKDVDTLLKDWTEQVGYPLVTVSLSEDGTKMTISQSRFLLKPDDGSDSKLLYTIPFTFTTNLENKFTETAPKFYLEKTTDKKVYELDKKVDWVVANIQQTGYYRVNYDEKTWHKIHHTLAAKDWGGIHEVNRAQFVDDLLNLARAGIMSYDTAFHCLEYLETETNYLPWTAAFNGFSYLGIRLGSENKELFGHLTLKLIEKAYNKLGFNEDSKDSRLDIYNRNKVLSWACKYGHGECITKAKDLFKSIDTKPVPVNIRSTVYCTGIREGKEAEFDKLWEKFKKENVATEQTLILGALGCTKESKVIEKFFKHILSDSIRRQDKSAALTSLYSENPENVFPVFELVTKNFEDLAKVLEGYSDVASVISSIAERFTKEEQKKALKEFYDKNKDKFGSLEKALKNVDENLAWSEKHLTKFLDYLKKKKGDAATQSLSLLLVITLTVLSFVLNY